MSALEKPLPSIIDEIVPKALSGLGFDLENQPGKIAETVLQLSDHYLQRPGTPTPWHQAFCTPASLAYFLPLNTARLTHAWREVRRFLPESAISEIWDFGSGMGTTQWMLEDQLNFAPRPLHAIETAKEAVSLHRRLQELCPNPKWRVDFHARLDRTPQAGALAVFSYAFLEMQNVPIPFFDFDHLLIVEPSTRECGRALMEWRSRFLQGGHSLLAPCTHAVNCPLLTESLRDWCHTRVAFSGPQWWPLLEAQLPMKNRTLTYSYLLLSRKVENVAWKGQSRVIGDTLEENGKTRQMICRGTQREFLSWLHRHGPAPQIPHGALVKGVELAEIKGQELRPPPGSLTWTT